MTSLGAASIELSLDRSRFDRDLAQLSQENAPSLTPKLKLDVKDFNNQIAGLQGFIPPISVPVTLDTSSIRVADVRRQFSDIGRNAALGFAEGFAGADKGIESTIDSLVKNAKSQLEIQSPSRVFRQIGKYAADGLVQGLQDIDKASLKGFVNEVEDYFKRTKIELYPDTEGFEKKIRGVTSKKYSTTIGLDDDNFSDKIEKSFEKALKRVEGKGFGSNLMSAIAAPLKFAGGLLRESLSGAFLGVGLPIGEQLGHGLAKGVESQVSGIIGSVDVLGEKIAQRLPAAINSKVKQVPLLNSIFSSQSVTDAQKRATSFVKEQVVGQDEVQFESLSLTTRNREAREARKRQAAQEAGRQYDRSLVDAPKDLIVEQSRKAAIKQATSRQNAAQKELEDFLQSKATRVSAATPDNRKKVEEENLIQESELIKKLQTAISDRSKLEEQLRSSQSRSSQALAQLEKIGIDTSPITNSEKALSQITKKGQDRIKELTLSIQKLYADRQAIQASLATALSGNDDETAKTEFKRSKIVDAQIAGVEQQFKDYASAYKQSVAEATAEVIRSQAALLQNTAFPEKNVQQVAETFSPRQKINLVGYQASTGTQLESIELQRNFLTEDLRQQTEGIGGDEGRKKAENILKELKQQAAKLQEQIKKGTSSGGDVKSQTEALNNVVSRIQLVDSTLKPLEALELEIKGLDPIIESAKKQQQQIEKAVQQKLAEIEKADIIVAQKSKAQPQQSISKPNETYAKIVQSAAAIAGLEPIPENLIPKLESSKEVAGRGDYSAQSNTYRLRPDLYKQLQTNDIDQISEETIGNILHELYHAFQHGLGKAIADKTGKPSVELQPTSEELLKLGDKIESSVAIQPDSRQSLSRKLETDANVFQLRNTSQVTDSLRREQYSQQALSLGGVAGSKISLTEVNKIIDQVQGFIKEAQTLGADIKEDRDRLFNQIKNIRSTADTVGAKSVDLQALSTEEIKGIISEYQRLLREVEKIKKEIPVLQASLTPVASSSPKESSLFQHQEVKDPWLDDKESSTTLENSSSLKDDLLVQLQKSQLKRVAKELGVTGISKKNKPEIVDSILQSDVPEDAIREKLPKFRIPTEKIIQNATEVSQLASSELVELTQETINEVASALKSLKASPAGSEKLANLQNLLLEIDELELTYIAAKTKVLEEELRNILEGRIKSVQKQRVATIFEMKPLQPGTAGQLRTFDRQPNPIREAEANSTRRELGQHEDYSLPEEGLPKESTALVVYNPNQSSTSLEAYKTQPTEDLGLDFNLDSKRVAKRIQELGDHVKQSSRAIEKSVKAQEKQYAETVTKNIDKNSRIVDTALEQLEKDANAETAGIQANIEYQDGLINRHLRRNARRVQQKYGLEDTLAPQVETPLVEPKSTALSLKSIFGDLRQNGIQATRKQAIALNQQAQILLADIQTQLTVGNNAQKESELLQKQVAENEKALNKILNTIKRASEGKQPELTPGDLQRLSGRAQTLGEQIDEGKEKLALNKSAIAAGKELRPVTERLVTAASNSQNILSKGVVSDKDLTDLRKYNQEIKELFGLLGEPPIPPSNIFEQLTQNVGGLGKAAFTAVKGFLAFQGLISLQNFLSTAGQDAFKAYVEFDKLKTALNFASGGSGGGANNLAFVKKQVEDLAIPLEASVKGFTQLAGAARGTAIEGQQTKELFLGISQASTVLSLSSEDTEGAIGALEKILSEGKVSSEALREELGSRIPGAFAIAARSMGTTEEEFTRLLETGQVLSQDFLPKFGKQLQSEFGEASKTASDNAQSAIFKLQNSWLSLQQNVGEGVAPVAIPGLKLLSGTLSVVADHVKDLMAIAASAALVMSFNLASALKTVITSLIETKLATGTLGGGLQSLAQAANNSLSLKIGTAIFGVIEIVKLLNDQVNTDLVKSFDEAADAAIRAADASEKAFGVKKEKTESDLGLITDNILINPINSVLKKIPGLPGIKTREEAEKEDKTEHPRASSDTGKFFDDFLINPVNFVVQHTFTDIPKFSTTGESEKTRALDRDKQQDQATQLLLSGAKLQENEIKTQTGDIGQLPALDKNLRDRSLQQQILQAEAKRDYTDKGLAVPANVQTRIAQGSDQINQLNNRRTEIAQPYNEKLAALNQGITRYKSLLEQLKDPKYIANLGDEDIDKLSQKYKKNIELLTQQKNSLEASSAAYNINPILKFNDAYRKLNLTIGEATEKNQEAVAKREASSAQSLLQGFSTNRLASRQKALTDAQIASEAASADAQNQLKLLNGLNAEVRSPALQPQLQRLGVTPDSSVDKIQDILANTKDESDKAILEKVKSVAEQRIKSFNANKTSGEASEKVKQVTQDNTLSEIQFGAGNATAAIQRRENLNTAKVRKAQEDRTITETEAAEKIARIQLRSTNDQQKSTAIQLRLLNEGYKQGIIGAEQFTDRQKELTTEQTNLQKQSAEQQLAVFEAVNRRKLEVIERANKRAETVIAISQTVAATGVKQGELSGRFDSAEASRQQNLIDQQAAAQSVETIKTKLTQNAIERAKKIISPELAEEKENDLKQQLAIAKQQIVDKKLQGVEIFKAEDERDFQRRQKRAELSSTQESGKIKQGILSGNLDSIEGPKQQNLAEQQLSKQQIELFKSRIQETKELQDKGIYSSRVATDKRLELNQQLAAANVGLIDKKIQEQELFRAGIEKGFQRRKDASELQISQANTSVQQGYLDQFSAPEIDEKGLDLARTGVTLNNSSVSASRQISLLQEQLAGVDKLGYAEKDAADKKRSLLSEIEKLRQQQIQTEIDLIKNKKEIEINGIERVQKVEENRFRLASSNLEQQKSSLELYNASLDRTAKLEESRTNLQKAVSDAGLSGLDIRKQSADRALELSRRLKNDSNLDPSVANEINRQLSQAGFGTNELDILKRRQQIEDEIAAKKLDALKIEQEFQRKSLVLDLKRQQIAAQTAVYDAESSRIAAEKSKLEADNALRIAQIKRDPVEIQIAKVGVELADRDIDLSSRKLQNAKDNLGVQDELARNSVLTQEATQRSAIGQQLAADSARKMAGSLERAEASTTKMASESKTSDKASSDIFAQKSGEGLFAYNLRINQAKAFGQIVEKKDSHWDAGAGFTLATSTAIPVGDGSRVDTALDRQTAIAPTVKDTVSDALASSKIKVASSSSGYDQFADALRAANKGIESRLDKLLDSFAATINAPKSLTVISPNPVDDAAKIYNDMSKDMVRNSGL